jgi:tripartite-type tricarboxylate transporter receptor subunit TctC
VLRPLSDAVAKTVVTSEFTELMRRTFAAQAYLSPTQFRAAIAAEDGYWGKLLKDPSFADLFR